MTLESKWSSTKFTLPEDWFVKKVPRKSGSTIDTYYYDPETGRLFRSLKDVERYLTEGFIPTTSKSKRPKYHEKMQDFKEDQDHEYQLIDTSRFKLPDGWIVTEVPRKTGDRIDRFFYEPGTGQMFRSLPDVQKHLAQLEEENLPLSKAFKLVTHMKNYISYDSWKKSSSKKERDSSFRNAPPNKINWVIPSTKGDTWNAFVGDELVPDSVKQQWGKRFMLTINNTKHIQQE